ncbi:hypothetical protein [Arthrobacter sp. KK5.5]|uniref:hypothetical protein n=1 Tax=Arthrobacter sp. KK5.5 TaxID=3373084 RepID=UPI003EE4D3EB
MPSISRLHPREVEAQGVVDRIVSTIEDGWDEVADVVGLTLLERRRLKGGAILNPSIFYTD